MSMNSVPERLAALRAAMKANGVDVYLIPVGDLHASEYLPEHYTSLTYFSGFHGENSNFVVTMTESAVWADGRYFVQAEKEIAGTEIQLQKMGEPGVPTVEEYCAKVLPEGGKLGLCGLTASCGLVRGLEKALEAKHGRIKTLDLEDELWTEGRPALPATPAWVLPKEYAGFSPAEKLGQLRAKLQELGCTAQLVGKLDNLAWLLNPLRHGLLLCHRKPRSPLPQHRPPQAGSGSRAQRERRDPCRVRRRAPFPGGRDRAPDRAGRPGFRQLCRV